MTDEKALKYTTLNIEEHIKTNAFAVLRYVFSNMSKEQISYWKYELNTYFISIGGKTTLYDLDGYRAEIMKMVRRFWIEKYYPNKYCWILFKTAVLHGLTLGFGYGPYYADSHIKEVYDIDYSKKENIKL